MKHGWFLQSLSQFYSTSHHIEDHFCYSLRHLCGAPIITLIVILTSKRAKDSSNDCGLKFYDDLSEKEIISERDFILSQKSLNITPFKDANINDNHIYLVELQQPNKDEAIKFLDNNGLKPERVARVVVFFGGKLSPEVREYLVSPAAKPSRYEETTGPEHKYPIPYEARPEDSKELDTTESLILKMSEQLRDLFYESFDGYTYDNCTDRCLTWDYSSLGEFGLRKKWFFFKRDLPGNYLHPVGLSLYVDTRGSDVSRWKVEKVVYLNSSFDSVEELMVAYRNDSVNKVFIPAPSYSPEKLLFSSYLRRGARIPQSLCAPFNWLSQMERNIRSADVM